MTYPRNPDPSMRFVGGFMMKDPHVPMMVVVNGHECTCNTDRLISWAYQEDVVGLLVRGKNTHELAVRLLLTSEDASEFVRQLADLLEKRKRLNEG